MINLIIFLLVVAAVFGWLSYTGKLDKWVASVAAFITMAGGKFNELWALLSGLF